MKSMATIFNTLHNPKYFEIENCQGRWYEHVKLNPMQKTTKPKRMKNWSCNGNDQLVACK